MTTTLVIVDIQNDYFPGGKNPLVGSLHAAKAARRLLDAFRERGQPVVFVQHLSSRPGASFFLPETAGAAIHPLIEPRPEETVIVKHFPNSFRETPLLDHLKGLGADRLVICGMMTHMCVDATVRAAVDLGFDCLVAGEACATKDLSFDGVQVLAEQVQAAFLAALNGTYGQVVSVQVALEQV